MIAALSLEWTERVGWTLIHSLWQGAAVWVLLECALYLLRKKSAALRYLVACLALIFVTAAPWITFTTSDLKQRLQHQPPAQSQTSITPPVAASSATPSTPFSPAPSPDWRASVTGKIRVALPWLVGVWLAGLVFFALRLFVSWNTVQKLSHQPLITLPEEWLRRLEKLRARAGVRHFVRAGECVGAAVPMVLGWIKPIILLPIGVISRVHDWQIEAILLHELAHIRRHDFAVNLLQTVCETIFFYHPAVWSISRRIREERECACDDLAVRWCADPAGYAGALAAFEEMRGLPLSLAVSGEGDLLERIRRILIGAEPRQRTAALVASGGLLAVAGYLASMFIAPALASKLMTAGERIAIIEKSRPTEDDPAWDDKKEIVLTGTILTGDGLPVPKKINVIVLVKNRNRSSSISLSPNEGVINAKVPGGRTSLAVWAEGYAPAFLSGLIPKGNSVGPFSILLQRGFPSRLRLTDEAGQPLAGVTVTGWVTDSEAPDLNILKTETNAAGEVSLGNVDAGTTLRLTANKPGLQTTERHISNWQPDKTESWVLAPAIPTTGRVVDATSGQPIEGAEIRQAGVIRPGAGVNGSSPDSSELLARSDSDGRFSLETLNSENAYRLYVSHAGYQLTVFPIRSGDQNMPMALAKGLKLAGWIVDAGNKLPEKATLECELAARITDDSSYGYRRSQVLKTGQIRIPFTFEDLPSGQLDLLVGNQARAIDLRRDITDYVFELDSDPAKAEMAPRSARVEIAFKMPANQPPPSGALAISSYIHGNGPGVPLSSSEKDFPIRDGKVALNVPLPNEISLRGDHLSGYWFPPFSKKIKESESRHLLEIPVIPAGAIRGRVITNDALRGRGFFCGVAVVQAAPGLKDRVTSGGESQRDASVDHYVTSSLPFGGKYAVILWDHPNYNVSAAVSINAEHPIADVDMERKPGVTFIGRLIDESGKAIPAQAVRLSYDTGMNQSFGGNSILTDREGKFTIPNLNLDVPGYYEIEISESPIWKSTRTRFDKKIVQPLTIICTRK